MKKVGEDIEAMHFNTAVAAMMEYTNDLAKRERIACADYVTFLALLAPFAPHLCEELHAELEGAMPKPPPTPPLEKGESRNTHSMFAHPWPSFDPALIMEEEVDLIVQVNGRYRATMRVSTDITEASATALALAEPRVVAQLGGSATKKIIFVPGKLINLVV